METSHLYFKCCASENKDGCNIGMCYIHIFLLLSFYLYVQYSFVKIKEIFSFNLNCSGFSFICGSCKTKCAQSPYSQNGQSTQDQWLWLTAVSVSSCRGEPWRKSHPCRSWVSSAGHPTQQHLHLLDGRGRHKPWPPAWTLAHTVLRGVELEGWILPDWNNFLS